MFALVSFCLPWCIPGSLLNSVTYHIKQDGTGNFINIQEGIIAATDYDTVLVYPGTYYENIDYLEKSLTVASLYIITPEDSLINQTIIDGSQQFRCVKIDECETASIIGFTIQNGYAIQAGVSESYQGGGIFIEDVTNSLISNCKITNNKAIQGGGIQIHNSIAFLSGNTISYNWGVRAGGGLNIYGNGTIVQFDETNLNNIYLNYSGSGTDLFISVTPDITDVIVDTFSVSNPDFFFIASNLDYTFSCLNSKIEQIDQDLYVDTNGDDINSGITSDEPLQTIAWAQTLIKRNDENPHTIHLASGIYSPTFNNQKFPLGIKHGIKFLGSSPEETILDAENQTTIFMSDYYPENTFPKLCIENLKLLNGSFGSYGAIFTLKANIELNNVIINNCYGSTASAIKCSDGIYDFKNLQVTNNSGGAAIRISCIYYNLNPIMQISMENVLVQNNYPGQGEMAGSGGGSSIRGHSEIVGDYYARLINCDFNSNYSNFYNPQTGLGGSSGLLLGENILAEIINCTFGDNTLGYSTGCVITANCFELNIYNTILYSNDGYSFNIWNDVEVNISHSLIEGGDGNVNYYGNGCVNWLEGNIYEDPLWQMSGDYPYMLTENSPCIDAGTLELPTGIELPEFDLAGNPRIYGETIDMGAYEWQGVEAEEDITIPITQTKISNYPNPFNPSTTIKLDLAEPGKIELAIYNIKGQKVKTLLDAYSTKGHFEIIWRGIDDNKKKVTSGNYFIKLKVNGEEKAVSKCVLLK